MAMKYIKDLIAGDIFLYNGHEYKLTKNDGYSRQCQADDLNVFGSMLFPDLTYVEVIAKAAHVPKQEKLEYTKQEIFELIQKKKISELLPVTEFISNGIKYKLLEKESSSYDNSFIFKCMRSDGVRYYFYDPNLEVKLIKEYPSPFNTISKNNNILSKDKEKISNIVNNSPDKKLKLYLGCFNKPIPYFVNVDVRPYPETLCDVVDDILKLEKFEDNSVDEILSVHTLEHVGRYEYKDALKIWFGKLKKGGILWLSVPDIQACCEHYIYHHDLEFLLSFFVGSQKHKYDYHYMTFDEAILTKALSEVGFKNMERYDWTKTDFAYIDSYAGAYAKHLDRNSRLMSLNIKAIKP